LTTTALVVLANLGHPRKPSRAQEQRVAPAMPDALTARRQLDGLVSLPVGDGDLPGLRRLRDIAEAIAGAMLRGDQPDLAALNDLARASAARVELAIRDGSVQRQLVWTDPSPVAQLARRIVDEVAALDPTRLRRCAREECGLVFYDSTRSRTQRWHAEDPCGWRERQSARRARA
jgi:predicted RNA-binding Zn ribbon-like protein